MATGSRRRGSKQVLSRQGLRNGSQRRAGQHDKDLYARLRLGKRADEQRPRVACLYQASHALESSFDLYGDRQVVMTWEACMADGEGWTDDRALGEWDFIQRAVPASAESSDQPAAAGDDD